MAYAKQAAAAMKNTVDGINGTTAPITPSATHIIPASTASGRSKGRLEGIG